MKNLNHTGKFTRALLPPRNWTKKFTTVNIVGIRNIVLGYGTTFCYLAAKPVVKQRFRVSNSGPVCISSPNVAITVIAYVLEPNGVWPFIRPVLTTIFFFFQVSLFLINGFVKSPLTGDTPQRLWTYHRSSRASSLIDAPYISTTKCWLLEINK